ncbi:MAG: TonB-dependent receptor [Burkholderiales bacterium]
MGEKPRVVRGDVRGIGEAASTLFLVTVVVVASTRVAQADEPVVLRPVEVLGRYEADVGDWDSASQGAVTRAGIEKRPLLRPGEILEAIPGMVVTQHSGDGKANQYFLRGYNLDHGTDFATWVAGMPVNLPTNAHGQGYMDLNFLIPELVSRVVYQKGPYFAEDGDFASVGSARIQYAELLPANNATLTGGSFDYLRALFTGSPEVGPGRLVYGLEYLQNDGPWQNPANFAKYNGVLRYAQGTPANGFNVTAMAYKASWNSTDQIPQRAVDSGFVDYFGAIDRTDGGESSRYSLSGDWRQSEGNITRAATLYTIWSRLNLVSNFTYFLDNPVNGDQFEQAEKRFVVGGYASQTWFSHWGERHVWNTLGVQLRRDQLSPVALYSTEARRRLSTTREDKVTIGSISPYLSNTVAWTDWFRTVAGLRADFYRFDVSSNLPENSGKKSDSLVSPKLSAIFGPWANTEYFLNWGTGFHSNDARGTTITIDPKTGDPAQPVDALVRTIGYEVGLRSRPLEGLTTSLALWRLTQDSELLFIGDAGTTEASRPSERTGVEWLVQYLPKPWLAADLALAYTRARFTDSDPAGNYIPGAPDWVLSAGLTVDNIERWFGSLRWRYFGSRALVEDNTVRSQSTSLINARIGYAFTPRIRAWLDVFNTFNSKDHDIDYFYVSRLPGEPAEGIADIHFHPVESRALRLTVSLSY